MKKFLIILVALLTIITISACQVEDTEITTENITADTQTTTNVTTTVMDTQTTTEEITTQITIEINGALYYEFYIDGNITFYIKVNPSTEIGGTEHDSYIKLGSLYYFENDAIYKNYLVNDMSIDDALNSDLIEPEDLVTAGLPVLTRDAEVDQELLSAIEEVKDALDPAGPTDVSYTTDTRNTSLINYAPNRMSDFDIPVFNGNPELEDMQLRFYNMLEEVVLNGYIQETDITLSDYLNNIEDWHIIGWDRFKLNIKLNNSLDTSITTVLLVHKTAAKEIVSSAQVIKSSFESGSLKLRYINYVYNTEGSIFLIRVEDYDAAHGIIMYDMYQVDTPYPVLFFHGFSGLHKISNDGEDIIATLDGLSLFLHYYNFNNEEYLTVFLSTKYYNILSLYEQILSRIFNTFEDPTEKFIESLCGFNIVSTNRNSYNYDLKLIPGQMLRLDVDAFQNAINVDSANNPSNEVFINDYYQAYLDEYLPLVNKENKTAEDELAIYDLLYEMIHYESISTKVTGEAYLSEFFIFEEGLVPVVDMSNITSDFQYVSYTYKTDVEPGLIPDDEESVITAALNDIVTYQDFMYFTAIDYTSITTPDELIAILKDLGLFYEIPTE